MRTSLSLACVLLLMSGVRTPSAEARGRAGRAATPAARPTPVEEARRLLAQGVEHHGAGRFAEAVDAYRQSYALEPSPRTRVNLALALWKLGRPADAARELDELIASAGTPAPVGERAREVLTEIARELVELELVVRGTGTVQLDGAGLGRAPLERRLWLAPGRHELRVGARNERFDSAAGTRQRLVLDAPATALALPPRGEAGLEPGAPSGRSRWRWIVPATLTGAALTTGVVFGLAAERGQHDLDQLNRDSGRHDFAVAATTADRARRDALIANLGFAAAGVGAAITAWIVFDELRRDDGLEVGFGGTYAYAAGRF